MDCLWFQVPEWVGRVGGIGSSGGFLSVGPAVGVQVDLGIECFGEQFVVVVLLFPDVAQAVVVGIDNGVEGEDR
jgi:hypothetical protein